jgi:hypothetical protein
MAIRQTLPILGLLALVGHASGVSALDRAEAQIKAGFLYNFAKHTEWPTPSRERILCIVGQTLPEATAASIDQLPLGSATLRVKAVNRPDDTDTCNILYIGQQNRSLAETWLGSVDQRSVLTISDGDTGSRQRAMINLFIEGRRIRYDLNPGAARQHGLKFNSRLVNLADTVRDE